MVCPLPPRLTGARTGLLFAAVIATCLGARVRAAAAAEPFTWRIEPDTLRADQHGMWVMRLELENHGELGLYPDSLSVVWVNADSVGDGSSREGNRDLVMLARA